MPQIDITPKYVDQISSDEQDGAKMRRIKAKALGPLANM